MKKVFDTTEKLNLILRTETFVCNYRGQTFPVLLNQVCAHCSRDFGPLLHTDLFQIFQATRSFSSLQRFSIGFRSGDWLGHSRTLKCFLRSHSLVALAVCFGSLSCWKTQPRPIFNALTEGRRLLPKISRYMAPSILPSLRCSRPVPFAEKHPQSMMYPPPCFTVGMVFLGLYSSFFFLQTRRVEFIPNSSILVSSDHMAFSHSNCEAWGWKHHTLGVLFCKGDGTTAPY